MVFQLTSLLMYSMLIKILVFLQLWEKADILQHQHNRAGFRAREAAIET